MASVYSMILLLSMVLLALTVRPEVQGAALRPAAAAEHRMMADAAPESPEDAEDVMTDEAFKRAMDFSKAIQGPRGFGKRPDKSFMDMVAQSKARGFGR